MFSLGEKVCGCRMETREAGTTPSPAPMTPRCPLSLHDFSTTFLQWWFFTFIIFQWTEISNSCFESTFLFISIYVPLSQHLCWADKRDGGTTDNCISLLTLSPPLHNLYIKVVAPLPDSSPAPLFVLSGYGITLYITFYHLFTFILSPVHICLLSWIRWWFITHLYVSSGGRSNMVKGKITRVKKLETWVLFWPCYKVCKWLRRVQSSQKWGVWARYSLRPYKMNFTVWLYTGILFNCSPILVIFCSKQKK